jgi:type IV pilus assembly protein PilY1
MTKKDPLPANWQVSTLIDNNDIGPVTAAVVKINDSTANNLWVYFGEGRYYYLKSNSSDDPSPSVNRRLFGIKDKCLPKMKIAGTPCSDSVDILTLNDVTSITPASTPPPVDDQGWVLSLDPKDTPTVGLNAERDITDPLATSGGVVYFTTYKPYTDLCTLGGKAFIWAFKYDTGGIPTNLRGKVLVQVSTGSIEQKDLASAFGGDGNRQNTVGRKTGAMEGKPPEMQGLSVVSAPAAVNRTIHVRER